MDRRRGWFTSTTRKLRPLVLAASFLAYFGVYGLIPVYAIYVEGLVTVPATAGPWIGGLHAVMWSGTFVGSFWWGSVNDRRQAPQRVLLATLVTAGSIVMQAWTPAPQALVPPRFIQGFCFAAIAQSVLLHASDAAPPHQRAGYVGVANAFLLGGQFTGPLVAGAAMALMDGSQAATLAGVAVLLAASLSRIGSLPEGKHRSHTFRSSRRLGRVRIRPGLAVHPPAANHRRAPVPARLMRGYARDRHLLPDGFR